MPLLPKSFFVLGASIQAARAARRLQRTRNAIPAQRATFQRLIADFARTTYGREHGIEAGMPYTKFRAQVPLRDYASIAHYIDRMRAGEPDVLAPGACNFYALSAGTTDGTPRTLPLTGPMLAHLREAERTSLQWHCARTGETRVWRGRHLFLDGSTGLVAQKSDANVTCYNGDLGGVRPLYLTKHYQRHAYEPGEQIALKPGWTKNLGAIIERARSADLTLIAGLPQWLLNFAEVIRNDETRGKRRLAHLQALWPNLSCLMHTGTPLGPFHDELRRIAGPGVQLHETYAAAEGILAAQDSDGAAGLRLFAEQGLFFEFLPLRDFDPSLPPSLNQKAFPIEGVAEGEDYLLLLTTPAGLCRYVLDDIVRFTSVTPPRLVHVGRASLRLNSLDEQVDEHALIESLLAVCVRHHWTITHFHVAPLLANSLTGQHRGRHEWWIELKPGTVETPTGPLLASEIDTQLMARSRRYEQRRKEGTLESPFVRLVMPGFFDHWLRHNGKVGGHHKIPASRNDRFIADELSAMACFNAD